MTDKAGLTSNHATINVDYPQTPPSAINNSITEASDKLVTITVVDNNSDAENDINRATLHIVGTANGHY